MLDGLITMCIIAHIGDFHFPNFVNDVAVITVVEYGRQGKYGIKHPDKGLLASHQVYQTLYVVEYGPSVVPTVSFGEGIAPFKRIERRLEFAVGISSAHQFGVGVEYVAVIPASLFIEFQLVGGTAQFLSHAVDTPVVVGILQCSGYIFVDFHIIGDISQLVIVFMSVASRTGYVRVYIVGTMQ